MKNSFLKYFLPLYVGAMLLGISGSTLAEEKPIRIMPLGDSITAGSTGNYRYVLISKLRESGYNVTCVGSMNTHRDPNSNLETLWHEGHGGKNVQWLAENMEHLFIKNPADIILLHAGHNNFSEKEPIPDMLEATRKVITVARSINPRVVVFLAQVISSGKLPKYSYIHEFNQNLAPLAKELSTKESPIVLVDQESGFDWRTDAIADMVHPNPEGGKKMAETWFQALIKVLGPWKK